MPDRKNFRVVRSIRRVGANDGREVVQVFDSQQLAVDLEAHKLSRIHISRIRCRRSWWCPERWTIRCNPTQHIG